jgi:L,D-transpeptidase YcbB
MQLTMIRAWQQIALYPLVILWCSTLAAQQRPGDDLRSFFEGLDAGAVAEIAGQPLHNAQLLSHLYRDRAHAPVWTSDAPLAAQVTELIAAIEESARHGLNPETYHGPTLQELLGESGAGNATALELLATDAFLTQARHRAGGAVSPRDLDPDWHLPESEVDPRGLLSQAIDGADTVRNLLEALWPDSDDYRALVDHRAHILALGDVEVVQVPAGPLLRPGQSQERVVSLKERLLGPGDHSPVFDDELRTAVLAFQRSAGLETDGIVGPGTLEVMNASRFSWIDRIDANLERWRWLPMGEPDTYIRVNIASFMLRVIHGGEDVLSMDVIVGRPYRRTPVFNETIKYMVFNPFWNLPFSIAVRDKLPELKRDPAALAAQGYEVRPAGADQFIAVTDFDWSGVERGNFRHLLRQRPGTNNALGRVKFMLPNPHAVYLHDTPSRELFSKQERSFSSGCIRLSKPLELAAWILRNDGRSADAGRIDEIVGGGTTSVIYLKKPLPAYMVYFTAFTDGSGTVVFRRDLYQRDAAVVAALRSGRSS